MKDHELLKLIQQYSYFGIVAWFAVVQLIFPIPQEVALISIGYISRHIEINEFLSAFIAAIGIVCSDLILFFLSKSGSKIAQKLVNKFSKTWVEHKRTQLAKHSNKTLFVLLLLPEVRMLAPLLGGIAGVKFHKFILVDFWANLLLSFIYVFLGRFFYDALKKIAGDFPAIEHLAFIAFMLLIAGFIIWVIRKKYSKK